MGFDRDLKGSMGFCVGFDRRGTRLQSCFWGFPEFFSEIL